MNFVTIFSIIFAIPLVTGFKVTCNYQGHLTMIGLDYMCMVQEIDFSEDLPYLTEAFGNHMENMRDENVTYIFVYGQPQLKTIPKGLLNVFPNLHSIHVENSGLSVLNGDELNEYPNLKSFELFSTQIERVPANFFSSTPNIEYIFFLNNKIKFVGSNLLRNNQNLKKVGFIEICIKNNLDMPIVELIEVLKIQCSDPSETTTVASNTNETTTSSIFENSIASTTIATSSSIVEKTIPSTSIKTTTNVTPTIESTTSIKTSTLSSTIETTKIPPSCQSGNFNESLCKFKQKMEELAQIWKNAFKKWF